ncbi:MAG: trypsin-like peptidase domain-containing protein [Cyanobacteria bacterium]|nr:trypsin-like peptidase domain-containing protein [Cyanobacteriota bacterium]MDW8201144.1 HhoA/HhoB/HtrA family serine endopeptidase [Cyanobacteriota bacterium SKYGB_h_bin112]
MKQGLSGFSMRRAVQVLLISVTMLVCSVGMLMQPALANTELLQSSRLGATTALNLSEKPGTSSFVAAAVNQIGPAVVRIDTERTITRRSDPLLDDPFFRDFFGNDGFSAPRQQLVRGQGSGFIVDRNGILLTNAHVVDNADKVTVTLKDGRTFQGKVMGVDEVTDLAVVKLEGVKGDLPVAKLGDSDKVQVGDWAIAVGNPLGLDNTVTLGIVSTLKRSSAQVGIPDKRLEFIQTDAAINPGNSGGPLLNAQGEVIGINTAIRADAMGIGFAIPINTAKAIQATLEKGQKVQHPYIGIQMVTLTADMARENNRDPNTSVQLPEVNGVLVVRVLPNMPAAEAGLRRGDVIVAVDGQSVTKADELQAIVEKTRVGQSLRLSIRRGNQSRDITVKTGELREQAS